LISEQGVMSLEKVRGFDKALADAAENGLTWLVLHKDVRVIFPSLLTLVQSARNATGQIATREHEVQVLLRLQTLALAALDKPDNTSGEIPWPEIIQKAAGSRPRCVDELQDWQSSTSAYVRAAEYVRILSKSSAI
jgi:hypothetical protein